MCLNPKEGLNNQSCDKFVQDYCKGVVNMGENMIRETLAKSQKGFIEGRHFAFSYHIQRDEDYSKLWNTCCLMVASAASTAFIT